MSEADDRLTPECYYCGEHVGMFPNDSMMMVPGQWMPSTEYDVAIFVLDTKVKMTIVSLPNGQLAIVPGEEHPTIHAHTPCFEHMSDEYLYPPDDEDVWDTDDNEDDDGAFAPLGRF